MKLQFYMTIHLLDQLASGYTTLLKFETNREDLYYNIQ